MNRFDVKKGWWGKEVIFLILILKVLSYFYKGHLSGYINMFQAPVAQVGRPSPPSQTVERPPSAPYPRSQSTSTRTLWNTRRTRPCRSPPPPLRPPQRPAAAPRPSLLVWWVTSSLEIRLRCMPARAPARLRPLATPRANPTLPSPSSACRYPPSVSALLSVCQVGVGAFRRLYLCLHKQF